MRDILFLYPDAAADGAAGDDSELLRELQSTLQKLWEALHAVLLGSRANSKEARQWLINSIAALELQDAATKRRRFTQFLPGGAAWRGAEHRAVAQGMLQLLFEAAPAEVGSLIAQDALLLCRFFKSDPKRVPLWFGHFSMEGMQRFKYGAAALAQYALSYRAEMWDLLAWQGRHPQAPVAVAQRPHYFCELDVPRSVRHLLRDCPKFWSSREMRRSVEDGAAQLLALDPVFWSKELLRQLEDCSSGGGGRRLHTLLCRWMEQGAWRQHCQRLLHLLPQQDLLPFATDLLGGTRLLAGSRAGGAEPPAAAAAAGVAAAGPSGAAAGALPAQPGAWLVFRRVQWRSLEQLQLAAALGCCLPLLLRLLRDDDMAVERQQVEDLVHHLLLPPAARPEQHGQQQRQAEQPCHSAGQEQEQQAAELQAAGKQQQERLPRQQPDAIAAATWRLRRQLQGQRSAAGDEGLHKMLLLHLFASAFLVQQLSSSGSRGDAEQLQQLLASSGFDCQLAGVASRAHRQQGRSRARDRRSSKTGKRRRHRSKHRSSKKRKHKKRRRHASRSSDTSSGSSSEGSESDDGGSDGSHGLGGHAGFGGGSEVAWQLGRPARSSSSHGAAAAVGGLGLLDAVTRCVSWAYACWVFGGS